MSKSAKVVLALAVFTDRIAPGLWSHARQPTPQEWKATRIIRLKLDEASAKVRTGPPIDDDADYQLDCWAGVIPLSFVTLPPEADPKLREGIPMPDFIKSFRLAAK